MLHGKPGRRRVRVPPAGAGEGPPRRPETPAPPQGQAPQLSSAVSRGVRWAALDQGFQQVARFVITVCLTRFTSPEAYGLIGLGLIITGMASFITDIGMGPALVHRRDLRRAHVRTALTVTLVAGAVLAALTAATAGAVAGFFREPDLVPVLVVLSLNFPLRGLLAVPRDLLRRDLHFKEFTLCSIWGVAVAGVVGVVLAVQGAGVWALVTYSLLEPAVSLVVAFVLSRPYGVFPVLPGLEWQALKELTAFGAAVSGLRLLVYVQQNADNLIVGRVLGATALGYYSIAYRLMLYPIQKTADVIASVALPAFAALQHDVDRLRAAVVRGLQSTSLVAFPASAGVLVSAPVLVPFALGSEWTPAVPCVQVLALNGPRLALSRLNSAIFQAVGKPTQDLWIAVGSIAVYVVAFAVGVRYGIVGVAVGYTVAAHLLLPVSQHFVSRALRTTVLRLLSPVWPVAVSTLLLLGCGQAVLLLAEDLGDGPALALVVLAGGSGYLVGMAVLGRSLLRQARRDVLRR